MILVVILADYERMHTAVINETVPPNVLSLDIKGEKYENLQNEINRLSEVETILATNWYHEPIKMGKSSVILNDKRLEINYVSIDPEVLVTENITLKAGRNFPENMPQSTEPYVLVNEAAAIVLQSGSENIVGQNLLLDSAFVQVIGIMPNEIIGQAFPVIYRYLPEEIGSLIIKVNPGSEEEATKAIYSIWKDYFPEKTANLQNFKEAFVGESSLDRIGFFGFFALVVMIIAGLGILGIASYSVETRNKELGIRKVLGASKTNLVWTVTRNFGVLILVAGFIGVPAGLFGGNLLRQDMGSQIDPNFLHISIGFGLVAILGLLTVLSQTIRAGRIKPVKVLKSE